jgi:uncharacterized protein (TIGR02270 family)
MLDVIEEHLDEAAFLWSQWQRALEAPDHHPEEVAGGPEERMLAHLDGLALARPDALGQFTEAACTENEAGKVFSTTLVLLERPESEGGVDLLLRLLRKDGEMRVVGQALGLCRRADIEPTLIRLLGADEPRWQAASLTALAMRGRVGAAPLQPLLSSRHAEVQAAALRAARFAGPTVRNLVELAFDSPLTAVRDTALETGLVLGLRPAYLVARRLVEKRGPDLGFPLAVLAMSGDPADLELIADALSVPELCKHALWALGISGWPRAADLCLPYLADAKLGRLAGEAFCAVTGLVLKRQLALEEPEPPDEPVPFEEEDLEADLVPGPEAALPLPDPAALDAWWKKERARFNSSIRYLAGKPFAPETMLEALRAAPMRRRPSLALELAVSSRGEYKIETRTWVRDQLRMLSERRLVVQSGFGAPFARLLQA